MSREKSVQEDYEDPTWKASELRKEAARRKLSQTGSKKELVERLVMHQSSRVRQKLRKETAEPSTPRKSARIEELSTKVVGSTPRRRFVVSEMQTKQSKEVEKKEGRLLSSLFSYLFYALWWAGDGAASVLRMLSENKKKSLVGLSLSLLAVPFLLKAKAFHFLFSHRECISYAALLFNEGIWTGFSPLSDFVAIHTKLGSHLERICQTAIKHRTVWFYSCGAKAFLPAEDGGAVPGLGAIFARMLPPSFFFGGGLFFSAVLFFIVPPATLRLREASSRQPGTSALSSLLCFLLRAVLRPSLLPALVHGLCCSSFFYSAVLFYGHFYPAQWRIFLFAGLSRLIALGLYSLAILCRAYPAALLQGHALSPILKRMQKLLGWSLVALPDDFLAAFYMVDTIFKISSLFLLVWALLRRISRGAAQKQVEAQKKAK